MCFCDLMFGIFYCVIETELQILRDQLWVFVLFLILNLDFWNSARVKLLTSDVTENDFQRFCKTCNKHANLIPFPSN